MEIRKLIDVVSVVPESEHKFYHLFTRASQRPGQFIDHLSFFIDTLPEFVRPVFHAGFTQFVNFFLNFDSFCPHFI